MPVSVPVPASTFLVLFLADMTGGRFALPPVMLVLPAMFVLFALRVHLAMAGSA